jgi:hypothetical protein
LLINAVAETLDKIFKGRGEDSYRKYIAFQELERRLKREEFKEEL